ncbi:MAG: thioesterase domain-containing protein [Pseudomonadota bacterium]
MYRVFLKSAVFAVASFGFVANAEAVEVYLFKGAGDFSFVNDNLHFSRGLNKIADTLNAEGIHAEVRRFSAVEDALRVIRERKPETVAFIGHSMGALASMAMARNLRGEDIKIVYMGLIDIPGPVGVAGDNVEQVENYFSINPVYGKLTNVNSHPNAKNIHVAGYMHNRMDDSPQVQNGMLNAIRRIHAAETQEQPDFEPETLLVAAPLPQPLPAANNLNPSATVPASVPQPAVQAQSGSFTPQNQIQTPVSQQTIQEPVVQPYALPSVSIEGAYTPVGESQDPLLQQNAQVQQITPPENVDPVTTSSVQGRSLADRGRSLLSRAGALVRRWNETRSRRPETYAPKPDR